MMSYPFLKIEFTKKCYLYTTVSYYTQDEYLHLSKKKKKEKKKEEREREKPQNLAA